MRILHIAPQNISDVPMKLVRAERELGHESRLITFFADPRGYPEDVCLHLPFVQERWIRRLKARVAAEERLRITHRKKVTHEKPPVWSPSGSLERLLIWFRERLWQPKIRRVMKQIGFWDFDVYQFDAGLDFFRDGRIARAIKSRGKPLIVTYTGSDLRTRGIIRPVDDLADVRITFEWDHLELHPRVHHVLFPFEPETFPFKIREPGAQIKIGHAPTNRAAKGSDLILAVLKEIQHSHPVEIVLIENKPYQEALKLKDQCDLFIDQLGDLGYGLNALEAVAMGIPTCTSLVPAFQRAYPDHPFVKVDEHDLKEQLLALMKAPEWRRELAVKGRKWVETHHDSRRVVERIHALAGIVSDTVAVK